MAAALLGLCAFAWQGRAQIGAYLSGTEPTLDASRTGAMRGPMDVPVIVGQVTQARDTARIWAVGTARAARTVTLYARAAGEVVDLRVSGGERVSTGDLILRLDFRQAALVVSMAEAALDEARRALARQEELLTRGVSAVATVDTARTTERTAQLELEQARESLVDRVVHAPFDGIVSIPNVELGDRISDATAILSLDDRTSLIVEFEVAEAYLPRLEEGMTVEAATPGFADRTYTGAVTFINSRIDPVMRTVLVRAQFANADDELRPGMSFTVHVELPGDMHPMVPELALQWGRAGAYVWRVTNGKAEQVPVRSVRRRDGFVLVEGDIMPGDLVVVEGVQRLRPGRPVLFTDPGNGASAAMTTSAGGEMVR